MKLKERGVRQTNHITLVFMDGLYRLYSTILFVSKKSDGSGSGSEG